MKLEFSRQIHNDLRKEKLMYKKCPIFMKLEFSRQIHYDFIKEIGCTKKFDFHEI